MSGPPPQRPHPSSSQMVSGPSSTSVASHVGNRPPMGAPPYGPGHPMSRPPQQQHPHSAGSMYPHAPSPSSRPGMPGSAASMQQGNAPPSGYPYHHPHTSAMRNSNGGPRHPSAGSMPPPQHTYHPSMGYPHQSHPSNHTNPPTGGMPPHGQSMPPSASHHHHGAYHHPPPQQQPSHIPARSGNSHPSSTHSQQSQSPTDLNRTQPSLNGTWHSNSHLDHRKKMIEEIKRILLKKDNNPSEQWLRKLPDMVRHLEVQLYRSASSFEEYLDFSTLKMRLQHLAKEIAHHSTSSTASSASKPALEYPSRESEHARRPDTYRPLHAPPDMGKLPQFSHHPALPPPYAGQHHPSMPMQASPLHRPPPPSQPSNKYSNPTSDTASVDKKKVVNMDEINPILGSSSHVTSTASSPMRDSRGGPHNMTTSANHGDSQETGDMDVRTKFKQQRLLLLHHASQCNAPDGQCAVSEHCTYIKTLWRHMENCTDYECTYSHCVSSRSILRHYRKCDDSRCIICGPVRDSVMRQRRRQEGGESNMSVDPNQHRVHPQSIPPTSSSPPKHSGNPHYRPSEEGYAFPQHNGSYTPSNPHFSHNTNSSTYAANPASPYSAAMYKDPDRRKDTNSNYPPFQAPLPESNPRYFSSLNQEASSSKHNPPSDQQAFTSNDRILYKQQRLLLLRHASLCTANEGECKRTAHCSSMKRLWEHIKTCKNEECAYPHCISSRYVLGHYRKCKDQSCEICEPVRQSNRPKENGYHPEQAFENDTSREVYRPVMEDYRSSKRPRYEKDTQDPSTREPMEDGNGTLSRTKASIVQSAMQAVSTTSSISKKSDETSYSLINTFTVEDIQEHIRSLNFELPAAFIKGKCMELLKGLQNHDHGWVFNEPVNPEALGIPDYLDVIKHPMDLGTIGKKLENGAYSTFNDFFLDIRLTFANALQYNQVGSPVYEWALILKEKSEKDYQRLQKFIEEEMEEKMRESILNEKGCVLCGHDMLLYEPPTLFCSGTNCPNQRIGRNRNFYSAGGGNNCYYWCTKCYDDLDATVKIDLPDLQVSKADLKRRKNDEVIPESWVQCDDCKRWVHYVCSLFNCRQNKDASSRFSCPYCLIKDLKSAKITPLSNAASAEELPRTTLSEYLEEYLSQRIYSKYEELAMEKAEIEKIPFEEAKKEINNSGKIIIRQVSATDRKLEVRERMRRRYAHKNYPDEFPYRCKCIAVFQTLDGVDVLLFALYLYEHGENNASPNTKKVYISYLDSVHFMRPRKMRTFIYHEILIGYLDYARRKGFVSAHIWACPPLKGDDYIFYCKPEDQKTPRDTRLRQWYMDMLVECQKRDIVGKITNMYDLYIVDTSLDATAIPYLEGDYFSGEAENIIKDLEEGKGSKSFVAAKKNKKKKGKETNYSRSNSTVTEVDDESDRKSICSEISKEEERDAVLVKLGDIIRPMKDSFIVAFLNWEGVVTQNEATIKSAGSQLQNMEEQKTETANDESSAVRAAKVIDDDKEDIDSDIINSRQAFLNLCRVNYYQFDQLRRAKYSSMMILWHLHNRDAPKFVQQCSLCKSDLLSGNRYHCSVCPDFDICEECYQDPNVVRGTCKHDLIPQPVDGDAQNASNGRSQLTEEQRRTRQEMSAAHIQLIEHASLCENPNCPSTNCPKMKKYLQHHSECKLQNCKICKNILLLLRMHAVKCSKRDCRFPLCMKFRERLRQLAQQQQAMDDRRRQEMNRHYRMGGTTVSDE